jgi:hypothetical protein
MNCADFRHANIDVDQQRERRHTTSWTPAVIELFSHLLSIAEMIGVLLSARSMREQG